MSVTAVSPLDLVTSSEDTSRTLVGKILQTCGAHRLVDCVTAQTDTMLEVRWTPAEEGPWYRTNDDGQRLLMPGTITTELAVQAGELLIYASEGGRRPGGSVPALGRMTRARFTGPVPPGATLRAQVKLLEWLGPAFYVEAAVWADDAKVMSARLTFTATQAITRRCEAGGSSEVELS